ncbi:transcription factor with AP2 domain(s) (ApiAP2) [Babesia microti strain RI]|uniref:Transcription factor with AP2 domain(S) (ApiAP2) n=1 Tax=Babesia microti (strain RI) TaxID=1133968 RepID=I7J5A6_BABMR|nr:transcription factor with AP2 domain(s) (ApiAP2) [Babesia microti strain RI]CCF72697.1 transcription factor with AP2 domain(s) (ApiAP2) [Babesia microti strain RI]|eukprot:XP_012647306.1 transcription factor with AP2 domain(s) (ApiAP2) [Babesia microti strain RI]
MSNGIIESEVKDIEYVDDSSKTSRFLENKDCNNDLYSHSTPNDVDELLTCIKAWKKGCIGSDSENLDKLILSEKLLENDRILSCNKSDSTTVSDGCDEIIKSNFEEITPDSKSDNILKSSLEKKASDDTNTLLTVEDILFSSMNDPYEIELYNKKSEILPKSPPLYKYGPVAKTAPQIVTNVSNASTINQNFDMKMIEEAAASSEKVRGVCFCKSDKSWTAWWTEKGRNRKKAFKLSIYGFEEARRLAIAHRKAVENKIPELKCKSSAKIKAGKRQVNRCSRVTDRQIHNINDEIVGKRSYNDVSRRVILNDKKRTKFCHYYKSPYQVVESIRECSTAEDSQILSPLTSKTSIETLENEIIHNSDGMDARINGYVEPGKQDNLDNIFTDTPRGVSYSIVNQAWCTQWCNNNGAPCIKSFSVSKYGFERSRAMAIEHRRMLESTDQIGSRIPGVFFKDNAWCATWTDLNGKRNFRSFPVGPNMTYDNARRIAIACKKNATNDSDLVESSVYKVNLELQDLYKLATCTLDIDLDDNINVEQCLQENSVSTHANDAIQPHVNCINKALNNDVVLTKMQTMMYNTEKGVDCMYNKWDNQPSVVQSQLIKEVPLQRQIANHLSRILLSNQIELQNTVNVRFLVGNGSALQQMLSHKQAKNKLFGLVLTTIDNKM